MRGPFVRVRKLIIRVRVRTRYSMWCNLSSHFASLCFSVSRTTCGLLLLLFNSALDFPEPEMLLLCDIYNVFLNNVTIA